MLWTSTAQAAVLVIVPPVGRLLALTAVIIGAAGCSDRAEQPQSAATGSQHSVTATLRSAPPAIAAACRTLARSRTLRVLCPTQLPSGRWIVTHRTLQTGRCAYLLDLNTRPLGQSIPFHALAGGRCNPWPLMTRSGRWPADPTLVDDLGLIGAKPLRPGQPSTATPTTVPPRVLRRVDIDGHDGLLLQVAAYPDGGVHGGHLAAIWNQSANGYALSLHFTERPGVASVRWQQTLIDAAEAMSRSSAQTARAAG